MQQKIKILHIIKSLGRGGAEMLLPETLKLHDRNNFEFHYIYFLPWKNQMEESITTNGGKVTCVKANNNFQLMLRVNQVVRYAQENEIELIHAHLPWAGILARLVGKLSRIPVIYTEHNKQERYHPGTRWMNLATINTLKVIVAVSEDVAESIYNHKPQIKARVHKIVNGVNTDYFQRKNFNGMSVRERLNIPPNAYVIGTIAVFRFQKKLDVWMEIARKILDRYSETHFIIVGDGPLKEELLAKRALLGLEERIHMVGLATEVRPYLACFDIYMMSSIFEGLPIALLEAMSMECSIITTDAGGIKEVIRHKRDGLLCAQSNPFELVDYAASLLDDTKFRLQLGRQARARVLEAFSMKKMVNELESLYMEFRR